MIRSPELLPQQNTARMSVDAVSHSLGIFTAYRSHLAWSHGDGQREEPGPFGTGPAGDGPGNCSAGGWSQNGTGPSTVETAFVVSEVHGTWGKARQVPGKGSRFCRGDRSAGLPGLAEPGLG